MYICIMYLFIYLSHNYEANIPGVVFGTEDRANKINAASCPQEVSRPRRRSGIENECFKCDHVMIGKTQGAMD